jgi:hypothetical protein
MEIIKGDLKCNRCGDDYFSKNATDDMIEHNICFSCILEYHRYIFGDNEMMNIKEWKDDTKKIT